MKIGVNMDIDELEILVKQAGERKNIIKDDETHGRKHKTSNGYDFRLAT